MVDEATSRGLTATIKDAERRLAVAEELIAHIEQRIPDLTSRPDLMPRQFAAVALARCCRLYRAIRALNRADMMDVCSLPVRPLYEAMLIGYYTLYGGDEAYDIVRGAYIRELRLLPQAAREGSTLTDDWTGPADKIRWENLGRTVGKLLEEEAGMAEATAFLTSWYDLLYRKESMNSIHAGVGSLGLHVTHSSERVGATVVGHPVDVDGTGPVLVAAGLIGLLAGHVLKVFGFSNELVVSLYEDLNLGADEVKLAVNDPA